MQEATHRQPAVSQSPPGHREEQDKKAGRIPWLWVIGTAIGLEVALVISAFAWVAIYSYLIHPGEAASYYENYAQSASAWVSIVLGIPYWFFACRWVGQKAGTRAVAMSVWAWFITFLIDFPLIILAEQKAYYLLIVAISHSTKVLAAYLGGRAALKRVS
jgi:hypothetical protein